MNQFDKQHQLNVRKYQRRIDAIYKKAAEQAAARAASLPVPDDYIFTFDDFPAVKKQIDALMATMAADMELTVTDGIRAEWDLSNAKNDALVDSILGEAAGLARYHRTHTDALNAFLERKQNGLGLSDNVWRYTNQFKNEIEMGLDIGIREGKDAASIARSIQQYLQYPDMLFRRVKDEHGVFQLSQRAAAFHPGQGVYRSSYKNALRLAATETNIAYRTADHERWQDLDFIVGIEVHLSNNHTILNHKKERVALFDICDELQGRYPKEFKFVGWHPNCRCIATTITKTKEEVKADLERIRNGEQPSEPMTSENYVKDMPEGFTKWMEDNAERLESAKSMPYFIQDNFKDGDPSQGLRWMSGTAVTESRKLTVLEDEKKGTDVMQYVRQQMENAPYNPFVEENREGIEQFMGKAIEQSDIAIRMSEQAAMRMIEEGEFKNAFETGMNTLVKDAKFAEYLAERAATEKALFGVSGNTTYGYLESKEIGGGFVSKSLDRYGKIVVRLKKDTITSATWTPADSMAMWRSRDTMLRTRSAEWKQGFFHPSDINNPNASMFAESRKYKMIESKPWGDKTINAREFFQERSSLYPEVQIHQKLGIGDIDSVTFPFSLKSEKYAEWVQRAEYLKEQGIKVYYKRGTSFVEF